MLALCLAAVLTDKSMHGRRGDRERGSRSAKHRSRSGSQAA